MLVRATLAGTPAALTSRPIGRGSSLIARPGQQAAQRSPAGVGGRVCLNCALLPPGMPVLLGRWGSRPQIRCAAAPPLRAPFPAAPPVTACPPPATAGCPQVPRASYGGQQQFGGQQQPGQGLYPPIYQSERRLGCAVACLAMPASRCPPVVPPFKSRCISCRARRCPLCFPRPTGGRPAGPGPGGHAARGHRTAQHRLAEVRGAGARPSACALSSAHVCSLYSMLCACKSCLLRVAANHHRPSTLVPSAASGAS